MEADFSGYATKAGLKCSDGRTITAEAFKHMDGVTVPLVWQHSHNSPENVLGHGILEAREDGMYVYGFFNDTSQGENARKLVQHEDVTALSIYANQLVEKTKTVLHGVIREVSLVLSGANPGALIDQVKIAHSSDPGDYTELEDEAIIFTGLELEHADVDDDEVLNELESQLEELEAELEALSDESVAHADDTEETDDLTVQDVYDSMSDPQKQVLHMMVGAALKADDADEIKQSSISTTDEGDLTHQEGTATMANVFEKDALGGKTANQGPTLSHADLQSITEEAKKIGSFKQALEEHALAHGIENIDLLFPDAKLVTSGPELIKRRTEWVNTVLGGARKSPFSRIKSLAADLTAEEARAKGYVKGSLKKEEIIRLLKRVTTPTTIYKKQKLDRDDIIDITDLDVVAWLKSEMRLMLEEELARAVLVGDGRDAASEDKIDEEKLRPIASDHEMYTHPVTIPSNSGAEQIVESVLRARKFYKGTGVPTLFTTDDILTDLILIKDKLNRRMYGTEAELAAALRVDKIVVVEVMEDTPDILGVIVNMADYTIGADRGGDVNMFDDFDIDYNQYKYLIETRASGALTKPKSAVVIKRSTGVVVVPATPVNDFATNALTIPSTTGVDYYDVTNPVGTGTLLSADTYYLTRTTDVEARPKTGYSFAAGTDATWTFAFNADAPAAPNGEPTL